jgi:putative toxin-antitoxin system antitoxin component (TIGR02293 family)
MVTDKQKKHTADLTALNKAIRVYIKKIDKTSSFKIKTEELTYSDFFENKMLIIRTIRAGLPYKLFNKIKEVTPFTEDDWAEYLNLSKKTLLRHRNDANYFFKPIHTEKIIELAEVTNFGKEVFDSTEQFYLWLNTPSYALGNLKPAELLKDSYGKELVMGELNRIDQGIFA